MSSKTKVILVVLIILLITLAVVGISYVTSKKAVSGPSGAVTPPPIEEQISTAPKLGRFDLGEFFATSRDEELHYIKIQVELGYTGTLDKELEERKAELRDKVINILMKLTMQRAKEDYIDGFLHKDIERELNNILERSTSESRIVQVVIPAFLIN
ncbi:MAG: flagellar basal body-associated FliL family protein [Erysipelotrichia bacterium]|nr:flagellar basal body-associated FliL family protein [Erysipelotrichia bacterium]